MTEKRVGSAGKGADVFHLPKQPRSKSLREEILQEIASSFDGHFRQQNELVRQANAELSDQVQRLMTGIDRLVSEMNGVRTGTKQEAFAKVGAADAPADLPTVGGEAALFYTLTAADIAEALGGFRASEIGVLLGARGLRWAGNSDYQELARHKKATLTKFWHKDIVQKIRLVLDENLPAKRGISDKLALAVFRKWKKRQAENDLLFSIVNTGSSH